MDFAGAIEAVVLDLDDTLFDTSGTLIGPANRESAAAMIGAGLPGTVEAIAQRRMTLSRAHPGEDPDVLTVKSFGLEDRADIAAAGRKAFYSRTIRSIEPFPETMPLLETLRGHVLLVLMTTGAPATQRRKVELLGIEGFFAELVFLDIATETKHDALVALQRRRGWNASAVVVVGDRIDREIAAGRRLGMWTVRVAHGEGRHLTPTGPAQQPHYTIDRLDALLHVLQDIVETGDDPASAMAAVGVV
jgi:putative hydrolase of the HAD superfamily